MDEIEWDYEELKKSLLDSASDYDRILKNMKQDDNTTYTRMEPRQETESEESSKE